MKQSLQALLSGTLATIPGLLFTAFVTLSFYREYYFAVYALTGGAFVVASLLLGVCIPYLVKLTASRWRMRWWLFASGVVAWSLALAFEGFLSLTPLCVGQDNGDGTNDIILCLIEYTLTSIIYSVPMILLIFVNAFIIGTLLRPRNQITE